MDNVSQNVAESEYHNVSDLLGIELDNPGELLGRIQRMTPQAQSKVLKKLTQGQPYIHVGSESSRVEMESKFRQLPKDIREGLLKKRLQLVDTNFYIIKTIAGKNTIDIFQGTDQKSVGLSNMANQKLEKDNWFIISAIRMTYGVGATKEATDFGQIPVIVRNGEFELEAGNKKLFGPSDNELFNTTGRTDIPIGYYKVQNTKIIEPQVEIKMPVRFTGAAAADSWLKVTFNGTSVIPF